MKRFTAMILAVLMILTVAASAMGEENKIWQKGDTGEKVTGIQRRLKDDEGPGDCDRDRVRQAKIRLQ